MSIYNYLDRDVIHVLSDLYPVGLLWQPPRGSSYTSTLISIRRSTLRNEWHLIWITLVTLVALDVIGGVTGLSAYLRP